MISITKCFAISRTDYTPNRKIKYIVLHYTAGFRSTKGAAKDYALQVKACKLAGSADFYIDDEEIVQYNGDIENRSCWSVGGGKYTSMTTSLGGRFYNKCTNHNSISIEMCSNKINRRSVLANDTDWYITKAVTDSAAELTKYLMNKYNIPVENVIMHHEVTGKVCPNPWCVNEGRLKQWSEFKNSLTRADIETVSEGRIIVNGREYKCNRILKDNENFIKIGDFRNMGFNVSYNANTKIIILNNSITDITVSLDAHNHSVKAINIGGYNYISSRDLADMLHKKIEYKNGKIIMS